MTHLTDGTVRGVGSRVAQSRRPGARPGLPRRDAGRDEGWSRDCRAAAGISTEPVVRGADCPRQAATPRRSRSVAARHRCGAGSIAVKYLRGVLDTSTVVRLHELEESDLPEESLITAITLAELSIGPLVADDAQIPRRPPTACPGCRVELRRATAIRFGRRPVVRGNCRPVARRGPEIQGPRVRCSHRRDGEVGRPAGVHLQPGRLRRDCGARGGPSSGSVQRAVDDVIGIHQRTQPPETGNGAGRQATPQTAGVREQVGLADVPPGVLAER